MLKVLYVTSEAYPFVKTGGLGDVAYALPKALKKLKVDVRVIMPKYTDIPEEYKLGMKKIKEFNVPMSWRNQYCGLDNLEFSKIPFYFIDNEYYFKRSGPYGYFDDGERFAFFCKAVLEAINYMGDFIPDVIHCNDWQTGMIPPLLKAFYSGNPKYDSAKTVFTIHNLKYQGIFPKENLGNIFGLDDYYFTEDRLKFYDSISFMKGGLNFSDKITTVSKSYAEEIKYPFFGENLDGLLNRRNDDLLGIVNGIDNKLYNPKTSKEIPFKYNVASIQNKLKNKLALQERLGLEVNGDIPLIGMVSRLVSQKGLDLINFVMEDLMKLPLQMVFLGAGDGNYEDMLRYYAGKYPNKLSSNIFYDSNLADNIYAASDMFLMPSLFEPCGIGQLIALRFGTIPIVRETGGLKDTVHSYNDETSEGNGFSFTNYNANDMLHTINRATSLYDNKELWSKLVTNAMKENNSWDKSASEYKKLYLGLIG